MTEAHIRIDEGIKRGPRNQRKSVPKRRDQVTGLVQGIPPDLDPLEVIERYLTEQTTSQIAQSYKLSRKTLVGWLREVQPEQWKRVQIIRALVRKEDGNEGIEISPDALSLARAREIVKSAQWELERLDSSNYGQKQELTVKAELKMDSILEGHCQKILERIGAVQPKLQVIDLPSDAVQQVDKPEP